MSFFAYFQVYKMFLSKSTIPRNFTTNLDLANLGPTNLVGENFRRENLAIENLAENLLGPTLAVGFLVFALIVAPIGIIAAGVSPETSPSGPNNSPIDPAAAVQPYRRPYCR